MLLEIRDLAVDFHTGDGLVRAVCGVSFEVGTGETLGIVGESGSGKSQMMLAVLGLLDTNGKAHGSARLRGQELIGSSPRALNRLRAATISMIFQEPMTALNPHLSIGTQLLEVLHQHTRLRGSTARRRAEDMLAAVHMPDPQQYMRRYPHELSGGMRQRVMIAMCLLPQPEILIADEPTTALDVTVQAEILELLSELTRRSAMSLVLITHDLGVVAGICERVLVMYAGRVVEAGSAEAILRNPQHPYTQALLACVPRLDASREDRLLPIFGNPLKPGERVRGCDFAPRCRYAFTRCVHEEPQLIALGDNRAKACHLERLP
jgi:oligopeptide transport system ATP-binding protein